jgi:hypothetical protein
MVDFEKRLVALEQAGGLEQSKEFFERLQAELEKFLEFEEITRDTVNRFLDKIVVHEDGTVEIHYKFNIG